MIYKLSYFAVAVVFAAGSLLPHLYKLLHPPENESPGIEAQVPGIESSNRSYISMAPTTMWSETAMLVIDMQVISAGLCVQLAGFHGRSLVLGLLLGSDGRHYCCWLQKEFVDPAMSSPALLPAGEAIIPAVTEAVAVARQRGIFIVWVGFLSLLTICYIIIEGPNEAS